MFSDEKLEKLERFSSESTKVGSVRFQLQMNHHQELCSGLFECTGLDAVRPYYYCQTGMTKALYSGRIGLEGKIYSRLFQETIYPALCQILRTQRVQGLVYMIADDSKEIGIVFQMDEHSSCAPIELAEAIDSRVQEIYEKHFPGGTRRYRNTTALSQPLRGEQGIREGYLQTEALKQADFFRMAAGVLTHERLQKMKNSAMYRDVSALCRTLCQAAAQGKTTQTLALAQTLFLDMLKHSYSAEFVSDALSYLKQFLEVRLNVCQIGKEIDLSALCSMQSYAVIEEAFEAIAPVLMSLCGTVQRTGIWSDTVAYAAYYMRMNLNRDAALPEIAAFADTKPAYLSNLFHQQTGMTIKHYQTKIRMERACTLLRSTQLRVADIASQIGFVDRRYFSSVFKEHMGVTPQEYRTQVRTGE